MKKKQSAQRMSVSYLVLASAILSPGIAVGQAPNPAADPLIQFLTYRVARPDSAAVQMGLFSCGQEARDLEAARTLAEMGEGAMASLERELDELAKGGDGRYFGARWLELAYARIMGRSALPRLQRLEQISTLSADRLNADDAIALALGITSYVSDSRPLGRKFSCSRASEPRDALDRLILGVLRVDLSSIESALSSRGRRAFRAISSNGTLASPLADRVPRQSVPPVAVGYKFRIPGRWSAPPESLVRERSEADAVDPTDKSTLPIETIFTARSGAECGRRSLTFVQVQDRERKAPAYVIDEHAIGALVEVIVHCAMKQGQ